MTTIAVTSETATVNIISPVTAIAVVSGLFMFSQIRPMAFITVDLAVFALERKICLGIMIEGPQ